MTKEAIAQPSCTGCKHKDRVYAEHRGSGLSILTTEDRCRHSHVRHRDTIIYPWQSNNKGVPTWCPLK